MPPQDKVEGRVLVISPNISPVERPVLLDDAEDEDEALAHLQDVGMHAMEVRMRLREERLAIIRASQQSSPPQTQEFDDNNEHVANDEEHKEHDEDRNDSHPLPSVPEEEDRELVSFLDFQ